MDVYDSNNSGLKTMVDIWTIMYMFTEEYRIFDQKFHLTMWFFRFITWITLTCDYVLWRIVSLMARNHIWIKLIIYRVTPDPLKWYFKGFIFMWPELMIMWMLLSNNYLNIYKMKKFYSTEDMRLAESFMDIECQPCGIFGGISYPAESEKVSVAIDSTSLGYDIPSNIPHG